MRSIPTNYRITAADVEQGWNFFVKQFESEATHEEIRLADLLIDAGDIHSKTGVWPTVGEVLSAWKQETEERERKQIASWQDTGITTVHDFKRYEERLATGDSEGPFMNFMGVAVDLKTSGKFPTVGQVRAEIKQRATR
jgi:hypothetical protein